MKRPVCQTTHTRYSGPRPAAGFTMMEILVATALMLTIMLGVAWVFGMVGDTIANSRSTLEMTGELRGVAIRLKQELDAVTVDMLPPCDPAENQGYFEITEGAIGPVIPRQVFNPDTSEYQPYGVARNLDRPRIPSAADPDQIEYEVDSTVGDIDDILMFTTQSSGEPFIGRCAQKRALVGTEVAEGTDATGDYVYGRYETIQSDVAEVAYFVRGRTLYRRVLAIMPDFPAATPFGGNMDTRNDAVTVADPIYILSPLGFYNNDVSVRLEQRYNSALTPPWEWVLAANTLGDLTKRENRFAHRVAIPSPAGPPAGFPYHPHWWCAGNPANNAVWLNPTYWGTHYRRVTPSNAVENVAYPVPAIDPYNVFIGLGLPTLRECSHPSWIAAGPLPNLVNTDPVLGNTPLTGSQVPLTPSSVLDSWNNPHPYDRLDQDQDTGSLSMFMGPRVGEDVVLTNVVGFDVKVWDPTALVLPAIDAKGVVTDLNDLNFYGLPGFSGPADPDRHDIIPGVAVTPGDLGYWLAMAHYLDAHPMNPSGNYATGAGMEKYWPIGYGAYVDLGYSQNASLPVQAWQNLPATSLLPQGGSDFAGPGNRRSQLKRVYDTWSTHYESNWLDWNLDGVKNTDASGVEDPGNENRNYGTGGVPIIDEGTDGMDNPAGSGNGIVDDVLEQEAPAPYPVGLRGIQIKIRVFDPDSRQVRERTVICDFLPK